MPGPDEALFTQRSCVGVHSEGQFFVGQDVWHVAKISYLWFLHPAISGTHLHGLSQSLAHPKYPLTVIMPHQDVVPGSPLERCHDVI